MDNNKPRPLTVDNTFNLLRARLFSLMESSLPGKQAEAAKKMVRDITGQAWVDVARYVDILKATHR